MYSRDTRCKPITEASPETRSEESELIERSRMGDGDAYAQLLERLRGRCRSAALRILKSDADVEDALQEAFTSAYVKLGTFNGRSQFSTWVLRIVINSSLTILRKRSRRGEVTGFLDEEDVNVIMVSWPDPRPSAFELIDGSEKNEIVRRSIDELPDTLKEVVKLRLEQDPNIANLASRLGISVAATKSRLHRASQRIISIASAQSQLRQAGSSISQPND